MPSTTCMIDRDQRDGLYELVRNHLGGIGDVWIALEQNKDFATAERLGLEFGEDFRLGRGRGPQGGRADDATPRPDGTAQTPPRRSRELDGLVLSYLCKHEEDGPLTASAIGKAIGRSSGAVANCLARLTREKKVRQAKKRPRAYVAKAKRR